MHDGKQKSPDDFPMEFGPFIEREEGKTYKCDTCLDYGGLLEKHGKVYPWGDPVTQVCECQLPPISDD